MTVSTESYGGGPYEGNGANESFAWTGLFSTTDQFEVWHTDTDGVITVLTYDDHYTVSGLGTVGGGTVTYPKAASGYDTLPADEYISIIPALAYKQETDLITSGIYSPATLEAALDYITRLIQQAKGDIDDQTYGISTAANAVTAAAAAAAALASQDVVENTLIKYAFSDTVSMADPGAGIIRLNNAAFASVTAIAIDDTTDNTGNPDLSGYINSFDDSGSTIKGTLIIQKSASAENIAIYQVTGLTDNSGWTELAVNYVTSSGSFADTDTLTIRYERTGDVGEVTFNYVDGNVTITPPTDADVTLSAAQAAYGVLTLADGSWTATHNIIVPDADRMYWVDNTAGTYNATVKTAAGASVLVVAGTRRPVVCDGTDVIDPLTTFVKSLKGADVASATALPLLDDGLYNDVTGTTTITSFNTVRVGTPKKLHFDGALTLTHHATDLFLPGEANITTAAGDEAEFIEYATGDWRCTGYSKASGEAVVNKDYVLIQHQESSGTAGGAATAGGWTALPNLEDEVEDTGSHVTVSAGAVTFAASAAGWWRYRLVSPFYGTLTSQLRVTRTTGAAHTRVGQPVYSSTDAFLTEVSGRIEIAASDVLSFQYRVTQTNATNGLGVDTGWGDNVYSQIELWKE